MAKRKVTKKDLDKYPELKKNQIKVGQEYDFPDEDENDNDDFESGGGNGGNHPVPPPRKP